MNIEGRGTTEITKNDEYFLMMTMLGMLWGLSSATICPMFLVWTRLPFFYDLVGFTVLIIAVKSSDRFGVATVVGLWATLWNLLLIAFWKGFSVNEMWFQFFGYTLASIVFDSLAWLARYLNLFSKRMMEKSFLTLISIISAAITGAVIGFFFLPPPTGYFFIYPSGPIDATAWGGVAGWIILHTAGGVIAGLIYPSIYEFIDTVFLRDRRTSGRYAGSKPHACMPIMRYVFRERWRTYCLQREKNGGFAGDISSL